MSKVLCKALIALLCTLVFADVNSQSIDGKYYYGFSKKIFITPVSGKFVILFSNKETASKFNVSSKRNKGISITQHLNDSTKIVTTNSEKTFNNCLTIIRQAFNFLNRFTDLKNKN